MAVICLLLITLIVFGAMRNVECGGVLDVYPGTSQHVSLSQNVTLQYAAFLGFIDPGKDLDRKPLMINFCKIWVIIVKWTFVHRKVILTTVMAC